jgi:hypothetical protein
MTAAGRHQDWEMRSRRFIRDNFSCRPDGCGARSGEPCLNYTGRRGRYGEPVTDVHAARWRKFSAWARGELRPETPADRRTLRAARRDQETR